MLEKHNSDPKNIKILLEIAEYYFSSGEYENAFPFLLNNYSIDKEKVKKKLVDFFEALGNDHEATNCNPTTINDDAAAPTIYDAAASSTRYPGSTNASSQLCQPVQ